MYKEAGVPLTTIHLGGDEVPHGVWMGSPKCRKLMKEKGMTKAHDLSEYFITQMASIMQKNGLKISGWQEVAFGAYGRSSPAVAATDRRGVLLEHRSGF